MALQNIPVELWSEITSYLSRTTFHKMMGVHRTLFDLVMNDLYKEIRFISDDERTMEVFKHIKRQPQNARRVRRLVINPDFLPALVEEKHRFRSLLLGENGDAIFRTAADAMALCPNVYEVKIILHDHRLTHSFNRFLRSLWKAEYVGMRLQSLSIETTLAKVPRFLQPLVNFSDALKKLEEFNFDISPTRDKHDQEAVDLAVTSLRSFLVAFNGQLTTIGLSSPLFGEMDVFLGTALQFARLKKLEIFAFFGEDPKQFERLSHFIIGHAVTLKHLTIKPQPRYYIGKTSSLEYTNWINPGDSGTDAFASSLHSLESLHLGLCGGPEEDGIWIPENLLNSRVLPSLSTFAPCITSLILTGLPLSLGHISDLIDGLSVDSNGRRLLRSLRVSLLAANTLSSSLFDMLASKLNGLKSLAINYSWMSYPERTGSTNSFDAFCQEMQEKNYHEWRLEVLRLTTIHSCPSPHPNLRIMEAVAERFQFPPNIDCSYTCSCFLHEE